MFRKEVLLQLLAYLPRQRAESKAIADSENNLSLEKISVTGFTTISANAIRDTLWKPTVGVQIGDWLNALSVSVAFSRRNARVQDHDSTLCT